MLECEALIWSTIFCIDCSTADFSTVVSVFGSLCIRLIICSTSELPASSKGRTIGDTILIPVSP